MASSNKERFGNMLESLGGTPEEVRDFIVYSYHFIDDGLFFLNAREVLGRYPEGYTYIREAERLLKNNGWEGDGELELLWIPPFIGVGVEDTYGIVCFHVKQSNNGTSWFASKIALPFKSLERCS
ncbi:MULTISPECIES: hypothetical protein [Pseudomonas]|uniref:hypothetical protein n=1 Tax=Pseudomonas sp. TaxID=306 RepID=UPI0031B63C98